MTHPELKPTGKPGQRQDGWWARSRQWDLNAFKDPTPEQAYYLGFLMGDGNIYNNVVQFVLMDPEPVYGMAEAISIDRDAVKIYGEQDGRTSYALRFSHPSLPMLASKWGIVPRKSLNYLKPRVPDRLLAPFLRGLFDADGWYSYSTSGGRAAQKSWEGFRFGICGSHGQCEFFERGLVRLGYAGRISTSIRSDQLAEKTIRGRLQVVSAYHLLNGFPRLERKWSKLEATAVRR